MSTKTASFVFRFFSVLMLLILIVGVLGVTPARAISWIVTTAADTNDGVCNYDCSLREAIAAAGSGDTIIFDAGLSGGTIALSSQLDLSKDATIDGSALAAQVTISGGGTVRVFYVSSGVSATLTSLTISGGNSYVSGGNTAANSGGGIRADVGATLTLNSLNIVGNTATNSAAAGGLYNQGTLTLLRSTLSGNSAGWGGGIVNDGSMTVQNS